MNRRTGLLALVVLLVTIAGCAQVESTATIGEDGEIDNYEMDVQFSEEAWGLLQQFAEAEGYDSVEPWLLEDSEEDDEDAAIDCADGAEDVSVDEGARSMHLECSDPVIRNASVVNTTVQDDGSIIYRDAETAAWDEEVEGTEDMGLNMDEMEFTFTLVFPSEVTSSNADTVDGNEATWDLTEFEGDSLQATTGSASDMPDDDEDDTTDDTSDDGEQDDSEDQETDDGTDDSDDDSAETDGGDGDSDEDGDGEADGDDGDGASGFTLAGVLVALAALAGFGLRRRH